MLFILGTLVVINVVTMLVINIYLIRVLTRQLLSIIPPTEYAQVPDSSHVDIPESIPVQESEDDERLSEEQITSRFDERISNMKEELALMKVSEYEYVNTPASIEHPDIENLPHSIIPDSYSNNIKDEYAR